MKETSGESLEHTTHSPIAATERTRFVLLGASNLSLGLPHLAASIVGRADGPADLLVAAGHGRCYAGTSRFLGRILPGIVECGLWRALGETADRPTRALIADIGNDLMSGRTPRAIAASVEASLSRLSDFGTEPLLTGLPIAGLLALGRPRYLFFRSLLFPGRGLSLASVRERSLDLDERLSGIAERYGARLVEPARHWFGIDPIHIRRSMRAEAWDTVLSHWGLAAEPSRTTPSIGGARRLGSAPRYRPARFAPESCTILGRPRWRDQPTIEWADGSTLSCY